MLCSECNKKPAILFYKKIENGKESMEGYCADCAQKKGINPVEVISDQHDINAFFDVKVETNLQSGYLFNDI